jgi:transposase
MSFARQQQQRYDRKRRCARMKVLIGVDPHKATLAVAVVDEAVGELLECASFLQNRAGLRSLKRWAKRYPERRWAVENAGGLGRHLAGRLAAAGESVVDVPPKLSARVRVLSTGITPARTMGSMPSLPRWPPCATSGWRRSIPRPTRRCYACFPKRREDLVAERTRALNRLHGLIRDLVPGGIAGTLSAHRAARILRGIRAQGVSARLRRRLASEVLRDVRTSDRKIADLNERIDALG